jgi:hypothetical protein
MKRMVFIMLLLFGLGCTHPSGSEMGQSSNMIPEPPERKDSPVPEEAKEKSTVTWDRVFDDIGFLIRWLDADTIIFP